jgi:A/G-specific adenine glycosylase
VPRVHPKSRPPKIDAKIRQAFHRDLVSWYHRHKRDLPWRRTGDPYAVTLSEFMLQQTQVATVIPYYERWLRQFPNWRALAKTDEAAVLKAWEGLGYYTRARNLHKLARQIAANGGTLPAGLDALRQLPGIGPYTAGAIGSIALGLRAAVLDGNVMRVFARIFNLHDNIALPAVQKNFWRRAEALLPESGCGDFNQALMELGATVCTPRKPRCPACPLQAVCRAPQPEMLPVKTRSKTESLAETVAILRQDGKIWCEPGPEKGRLAGFWKLPEFLPSQMKAGKTAARFTYGITKYRVDLTAVEARWKITPPIRAGQFLSLRETAALPFSAAHRKVFREAFPGSSVPNGK